MRSRGESSRRFCRSVKTSAPPQKIGCPSAAAAQPFVVARRRDRARAGRARPRRFEEPRDGQIVVLLQPSTRFHGSVAPEELVRPLTDLADDDSVLARELGDVVDGNADRVGDRLVLQAHHLRQEREQIVVREQLLVVLGADQLAPCCARSRARSGSSRSPVVADGERLHGGGSRPRKTARRWCWSRYRRRERRRPARRSPCAAAPRCAARRESARRSRPRTRWPAARCGPSTSQYRCVRTWPSSVGRAATSRRGSLRMPSNSVCGAGVVRNDR